MDSAGRRDGPMVCTIPGKVRPTQLRRALAAGRDVVLLSRRDTDLRRALAALDRPVRYTGSVRLGDGRTATTLTDSPTPAAFAWQMREKPAAVWRWACRACGAVDRGWSWPEDEGGDGAAMVRRRFDHGSRSLVPVPWSCPRGTCHGAVRWHLERRADVSVSGTGSGT